VEDLADLAVQCGERSDNVTIEAIGPEAFTYKELVRTVGRLIGVSRPIVSIPPVVGFLAGKVIGRFVSDVMITREEIEGLMANLLWVDAPAAGSTRLTGWVKEHSATLGKRYTSELARRTDRVSTYSSN
jgi:NADH dehydrogenase